MLCVPRRYPRADKITLYTGNDDNIIIDLLTPYRFIRDGKTVEKRFQGGCWDIGRSVRKRRQDISSIEGCGKGCTIPKELLTLAELVTDFNAAVFDAKNGLPAHSGRARGAPSKRADERHLVLGPAEVLSPGQVEEIDRCEAMYPFV